MNLDGAFELLEKGDYASAFKLFLGEAESVDPHAMAQVASMYTCGEGVDCNYDLAIEWEKRAYKAGHTSAAVNLGITYRIRGDLLKARCWFETAMKNGDLEGALQLAKLYVVCRDHEQTVRSLLSMVISGESVTEDSRLQASELLRHMGRSSESTQ